MKRPSKGLQILLAVALLLYACGYVTQFIGNYAVWQKNGGMLGGTSPPFPSLTPLACLKGILWFPYSLYCMAGCAAAVAAIVLYRKLFSQDALTDSERNFNFSAKGTYGTSGWMQPREVPAVLDMVSDLSQHTGTVLGIEMDIRRLKDGYDVLDKLYDDNDLNCDNFAHAVREYRCSREVITAVSNLYLRQQIMLDTY